MNQDFIPATMEREIAPNIVFRPIRSWHSGTYAGEKLKSVNGDGSGCITKQQEYPRETCQRPPTVTQRIYWNKVTSKQISAFLSYPNGMGCMNEYFWEIYPYENDVGRFTSEIEMEQTIILELKS